MHEREEKKVAPASVAEKEEVDIRTSPPSHHCNVCATMCVSSACLCASWGEPHGAFSRSVYSCKWFQTLGPSGLYTMTTGRWMRERGTESSNKDTVMQTAQPAGHQYQKLVYHLKMMHISLKGAFSLFETVYWNIQGSKGSFRCWKH